MKVKNQKITLFFILGSMPTEEQFAAAEQIEGRVYFRNALFVENSTCLEEFDDLAGDVPEVYAKALAAIKTEVVRKPWAKSVSEKT